MVNPQNKLKNPTFFIVAGEVSGDLHGAQLINAIKNRCPQSRFVGHGGDKMTEAGLERIIHIDRLAIMGFSEVIKHLPFMMRAMKESLAIVRKLKPDRIILIDYPGFNLRLAKKIHGMKLPVTYFILPQLWAWKENRIKTFKKHIDQALSIFPFEKDWFEKHGVTVNFVGHPFSEIEAPKIKKEKFLLKHNLNTTDQILVLLPGSRQQEIDKHWDICWKTVALLRYQKPNLKVIVGKASGVVIPQKIQGLLFEEDEIRAAMAFGTAALTASGTATLECAALDIPQVVFYKLSRISGIIAKKLNKAPFAAMVNLIAGKKVVPEFLQKDATEKNIAAALSPLLESSHKRRAMLSGYNEIRRSLGIPGVYIRAADLILKKTSHG